VYQAAHKLGFLLGHRDRREQCRREASDGLAIFGFLLAIDAGISFVIQQAVNANLRTEISSVGGRALSVTWAARSSRSLRQSYLGSLGCRNRCSTQSPLFHERRDLRRDLHRNFNFAYSASWRSNGDCVDCGRADAWLSFVRMIAGRSGPSSECSSIDGCGHARRPRHPHSALSRIGSTVSGNPCRYSLNSGHSGRL
jgi:hypothetical protein